MSRRMLDSAIWSNENFAALPPRGRLLQIGMINIADDQGRLKAHPLYLAKEIFPYDHTEAIDVSKWLEQMVEHGTIELYMVEGKQYAQFRNWWDYQTLQFAHPSAYPRPEGWLDHLRFNSKGNQMLVANWTTPKGERMQDTCDQDGKPFPFVMTLPVNKKQPENPAAEAPAEVRTLAPTEVPAQAPTKVRTLVPTGAPAEVATEVPTQVTPNLTSNYQLPTTNLTTTTTNACAYACTLLIPEWNGGGDFLSTLSDGDLLIAASWLWLYQKLKGKGEYSVNEYALRYKPSPFAGITNPPGFIRSQVEKHTPAPLYIADRAEFDAELRKLT